MSIVVCLCEFAIFSVIHNEFSSYLFFSFFLLLFKASNYVIIHACSICFSLPVISLSFPLWKCNLISYGRMLDILSSYYNINKLFFSKDYHFTLLLCNYYTTQVMYGIISTRQFMQLLPYSGYAIITIFRLCNYYGIQVV